MRHAWFISLLLALPPTLLADEMTGTGEIPAPPPSYQMLRFDEDYSCLANPTNRTDLFDPLKYIPLRVGEPAWYLTLGGEVRERFEGNYDPNFGIGGAGSDSYLLQRITLLTDVHLGERVRVFAEGVSGLMEGESQPAPPVQQDPIDLQFAFVDVIPYLTDDERLTLRAGRFGMSFGAGQLVATRAATDILFRFDGFEAIYTRPLWEATAFLTQPATDSGGFNGEDHSTTFWGLPVGAGTDATRVASYNPWVSLYWMVTGKTVGGVSMYPDKNRLSRKEALRLHTQGSSWFSSESGKKGALAPGQLADFAVLSEDYLAVPKEEIKSIESVLTVVGGRLSTPKRNSVRTHHPRCPFSLNGRLSRCSAATAPRSTSAKLRLPECPCFTTSMASNVTSTAFTMPRIRFSSGIEDARIRSAGFWGSGCDCFAF